MKVETIEIISNHLFANRMYFEGFDRSQFTKLLSLSIYQQIDGVAIYG